MSTNVFSGARAVFRFDDRIVAFASGCDGSEEIIYEAVDVLDRIEVAEYVPVGYRVTFNCEIFRTVAGATASPGKPSPMPEPGQGTMGSLKGTGINMFPKSKNILTNGYMSASVSDSLGDKKTIYNFHQVKAINMNFRITARGIVGQNVSFNAIRITDESET